MAIAPVLPEGAFGAALLFWLLYWGCALGLAWLWWHTFHNIFQGIAKALTFHVGAGWGPSKTIHLGGWAKTIDHAAIEMFTNAAVGAEVQVGKTWHAMAEMFWAMSHAISDASAATLDFGHYIVHDYVPGRIKADLGPLWNKTNKAAAVAAATAAGLAALKKEQRSGAKHQAQANKVVKTETKHAQKEATHAKAVATKTAEKTQAHAKKMEAVLDVPALPAPVGRTVKQIRRLVRKHEAIIGATVFAAAMANVLGLPNPRCLTKGPLGRFSRALCGLGSNALNDLLGLLVDALILTNICQAITLVEDGLSFIAPEITAFITATETMACYGDNEHLPPGPPIFLSLPPTTGLVLT